jgi:hypothetical protein
MLNDAILVVKRVGLKSFVVSIDYRDYMGSSQKFECLFLYLCSYNLDGSVTAGIGAEFNTKHIVRVFKNKSFFLRNVFSTYKIYKC